MTLKMLTAPTPAVLRCGSWVPLAPQAVPGAHPPARHPGPPPMWLSARATTAGGSPHTHHTSSCLIWSGSEKLPPTTANVRDFPSSRSCIPRKAQAHQGVPHVPPERFGKCGVWAWGHSELPNCAPQHDATPREWNSSRQQMLARMARVRVDGSSILAATLAHFGNLTLITRSTRELQQFCTERLSAY